MRSAHKNEKQIISGAAGIPLSRLTCDVIELLTLLDSFLRLQRCLMSVFDLLLTDDGQFDCFKLAPNYVDPSRSETFLVRLMIQLSSQSLPVP